MTTWVDEKKKFEEKFSEVSNYRQNQLDSNIRTLNDATMAYISRGGVSGDPSKDADYSTAMAAAANIQTNRDKFQALNKSISAKIKDITKNSDMADLLLKNGTLQQNIQAMEKETNNSDQDVKAAELRDDLLRSQGSAVTKHQLFMIGHPLRPASIPFLWATSVLFIGAALIIFQQLFPSTGPLTSWSVMPGDWGMLLSDIRLWGALVGSLSIVIIFLSLRIANVI